MKNAAYTILFLFALLLPLVAAAAPTFLSEVQVNGTPGAATRMLELDDDHLLIMDIVSGGNAIRLRIVNPETGFVTDTYAVFGTYLHDFDYKDGTIVVCGTTNAINQVIYTFKWPEPGLLQPPNGFTSTCSGSCSTFWGGCSIEGSSSTSVDIFVGNLDWPGASSTNRNGVLKYYFNGSSAIMTDYPITTPISYNLLLDEENEVYGSSNKFYDISDPYNHTGNLLDTLVNGDVLRAWNFNSAAPEWVAENGYITIADDYSAVIESSGAVVMDEIFAYGGRDEILGIINGWWYNGDFSITPGAPTLTNTSVELTNYDPLPHGTGKEWLTTATRIYYINSTNDVLSTWEYQTAPTCSASNGCYIDEPFSYNDNVLNHGWSGWSVSPIDGQLQCFGSTQYNTYQYTPITPSDGTFYLEFDARICGEPSAPLEVTLFKNNDPTVQLRFTGDSANGTIQDHTSAYLTHYLGVTVPDPGNVTCSGTQRFENSYLVAFHPQNNPRTYDIYINGAVVSQNNLWTAVGQQVLSVNSIGFSGGITMPYCFWSIDNIKLYTNKANEAPLDDEQINEERNTIGGQVMSLDQQFHFDRDAHCETTENTQLCFLRWVVGGLLDWLWRLIVNNPLPSLAFILVAVVLVIAGHNAGKK